MPGANIGACVAQCDCENRIRRLEMQMMYLTTRLMKMEELYFDWS
jgi:hypothetical protein